MLLSTRAISPKSPSKSKLALAFQAQLNCAKVDLRIILNIGSIFLHPDVNLVDSIDFSGFSLTKAAATGTAAATAAASQATASQVVATTTAAAATATFTATLPAVFDARNLPADVRERYDAVHHPADILTHTAMVPFASPPGGYDPVLSSLGPPLSAGVLSSPIDVNRNITGNGQFFPLADQGNDGLKIFLNNIPSCHGTFSQACACGIIISHYMYLLVDSMFIHILVSALQLLH